jgi:cell shape-determining protein MreC
MDKQIPTNEAVLAALSELSAAMTQNFEKAIKVLESATQDYSKASQNLEEFQEAIVEQLADQESVEEEYQDQILAQLIELQEKSARIRESNKRIKKLVAQLCNRRGGGE